jgi:hypothetical protein
MVRGEMKKLSGMLKLLPEFFQAVTGAEIDSFPLQRPHHGVVTGNVDAADRVLVGFGFLSP